MGERGVSNGATFANPCQSRPRGVEESGCLLSSGSGVRIPPGAPGPDLQGLARDEDHVLPPKNPLISSGAGASSGARVFEFGEAFLVQERVEGCSAQTLRVYEFWVKRFAASTDGVDAEAVARFFANLRARKVSASTVDQAYRTLKTFARWCVAQRAQRDKGEPSRVCHGEGHGRREAPGNAAPKNPSGYGGRNGQRVGAGTGEPLRGPRWSGQCGWIADLLQHGLLCGSYITDRPQRELRELTRYRTALVRE
jgi:hypothetical protein